MVARLGGPVVTCRAGVHEQPRAGVEPGQFRDPSITVNGEERAWVALKRLRTLWFNAGTLCNLTCRNCYIDSSPRNDRLAYLLAAEVAAYLDEIERDCLGTEEIGFTGGEPFMNPEFPAMLHDALRRGFQVLVLTNAMRPMMKLQAQLLALNTEFPRQLVIRVSLDHYGQAWHEVERGRRSWAPTLAGLVWLCRNGFCRPGRGTAVFRRAGCGIARRLRPAVPENDLPIEACDAEQLVPVSGDGRDQGRAGNHDRLLGHSRHFPRRDDVCLIAYGGQAQGRATPERRFLHLAALRAAFELGRSLKEASGAVPLNHPHSAPGSAYSAVGSCSSAR